MRAVELQSLRSLKTQQPRLFTPSGLIAQSQRRERWLFWPMGVRSAGAMRVPGTQAIAFVGERHLDAPYLLRELGLQAE